MTIATDRKALQPSSSGDAEKAAGALLTEHPKLNAIWAERTLRDEMTERHIP